ncbi:HEPN domain-containing protein [Streptomyces sp. NPDC057681]|uniref:HEPN domain-containing protein n=1 Tax=Streptomyces sp. NPDC057681 TaxID=3346209 RepID=UPI003685EEFC
MGSKRFDELTARIDELRRHFIPKQFEPTGTYDDSVYEYARAFRVLVHAEFESFIEDRVIEVIDLAVTRWNSSRTVSPVLVAALAYRESAFSFPDSLADASQRRSKYPELSARIESTRSELHKYARKQNHGIKERNLLKMLLPVGVLEADLDVVWLGNTNTWASKRGEVAHNSAKVQVRLDPQKEDETVKEILKGFGDLDELLSRK